MASIVNGLCFPWSIQLVQNILKPLYWNQGYVWSHRSNFSVFHLFWLMLGFTSLQPDGFGIVFFGHMLPDRFYYSARNLFLMTYIFILQGAFWRKLFCYCLYIFIYLISSTVLNDHQNILAHLNQRLMPVILIKICLLL